MSAPTLTASGSIYEAPPAPDAIAHWRSKIGELLGRTGEYRRLDEQLAKRRAWLETNPWDERFDERWDLMRQTMEERGTVAGWLADRCADVSRFQGRMTGADVARLEEELRCPLFPFLAQRFVMTAVRTGVTRKDELVRAVRTELIAEWGGGEIVGALSDELKRFEQLVTVNPEPCPF